jgi:Ca-activated chloride channel family protein
MPKLFVVSAVLLSCGFAYGDGIIIPDPPFQPLAIKYHRVQVEIDDQTAHTDIDQVFLNPQPWDVEGTYLFPLPREASFSAFSMHVDGEELAAEILPADEARQIYEDIARRLIDPALLEYVGQGAYRARIFPIPAGGERRIELSYDEVLRRDAGIIRYVYPLNTEKFSAAPLEDVSVQVRIRSSSPIKAIYSPSHDIVVERAEDEGGATVIYADEGVTPTEDFVLYYTVSEDPVGIDMLSHFAEQSDEDGYYMLLAAPQAEAVVDIVIPKRMIFVFDRSGSMAGEKMEQAREALRFAIERMLPADEFNIVDYGTTVEVFSEATVPITAISRAAARSYIDGIEATGGTNIQGALLEAAQMLRGDEFAQMIVFLTDGKPTIGERDLETILHDVSAANADRARLFVFGVGEEVNAHLLDRLAGDNGGTSTYVKPGEDIEVAVSSFYTKVSSPVLTDLELQISGGRARDNYPQELPDLFRGSQIVQLGRLAAGGVVSVLLSGNILGERQVFERAVDLTAGGPEFLPRLWATRKVGFLLDQIRLHGEDDELVDEIVALSRRHGIITPYTSFLIVEDEPPTPIAQDDALRAESGAEAVSAAQDVRDYAEARTTTQVRSQEVRYVGDKTFFLREGFWVDSQFDHSREAGNYQYGSNAYFELLRSQPQLGRYLALGTEVVLRSGSEQIRIVETATVIEGEPVLPRSVSLRQNFPNPFNPSTTIRYDVMEPAVLMSLAIYDMAGQRVRQLVRARRQSAGPHGVVWDGRDDRGELVANGVYLYQLRAGTFRETRKMVLLK